MIDESDGTLYYSETKDEIYLLANKCEALGTGIYQYESKEDTTTAYAASLAITMGNDNWVKLGELGIMAMEKKGTDGKAHAILGASSSHRWMECPGSVELCEKAPKRTTSIYAEEGTAAHELGEKCLRDGKKPKDFKGDKINGFLVNDDMIDAVSTYVDLMREESFGLELHLEKRFDLGWLYKGMFGTNDASFGEDYGLLSIWDYKHGAGVAVEIENNTQLLYYALGAAFDYENRTWHDYEEIEMGICQPRAWHKDGPIRRWKISMKELIEWAKVLKKGAIATTKPDAPLKADNEHCRWCNAAGFCPELARVAQDAAKSDFGETLPTVETLSDNDISKILNHKTLIESFLKAVQGYAYDKMIHGGKMPDLKLIRGRGTRKWNDEVEVRKELLNDYKFDEIFSSKIRTPAQIEKFAGKARVKELCYMQEGAIQVAPLNDKRKEVVLSAALDFMDN